MTRMKIDVLPSIVTAALLTSIISAGNAVSQRLCQSRRQPSSAVSNAVEFKFTFNASRALHALALDGVAPKIFKRTNKQSVRFPLILCIRISLLTEIDSQWNALLCRHCRWPLGLPSLSSTGFRQRQSLELAHQVGPPHDFLRASAESCPWHIHTAWQQQRP